MGGWVNGYIRRCGLDHILNSPKDNDQENAELHDGKGPEFHGPEGNGSENNEKE